MSKPRYIAHTSGKQPTFEVVQVVYRDGKVGGILPAHLWRWNKCGNDADIIAYRVIKR
jgi:hypothetical protein